MESSFQNIRNKSIYNIYLVRALASLLRWYPIRGRYVNVQIVADIEFGLEQRQSIVRITLTRTGDANLTHSIARTIRFRLNEGKIKVRTFTTSFGVNITYQCG